MLRFWSSKLRFWRKSRRKASFFISKAFILKEVSQKSFVFELQSYIFEGSLAEKLRFWASKLHFLRKSRRNAWFLIFKASFLKEVSNSIDTQLIWISNRLTTKSLQSQINCNAESLESQINWQPHQVQINRQPKSFEAHIDWQPNHLNFNSFDADINWLSNHLHSAHPFPIGSLSLETSATALCGRYVTMYVKLYIGAHTQYTQIYIYIIIKGSLEVLTSDYTESCR